MGTGDLGQGEIALFLCVLFTIMLCYYLFFNEFLTNKEKSAWFSNDVMPVPGEVAVEVNPEQQLRQVTSLLLVPQLSQKLEQKSGMATEGLAQL